jgi:lipoprotein-releasing system permease protein
LGITIALILAQTNLIHLPADVYYIDRLPVRLEVADILAVIGAAVTIVLVATLYPSHRATQIDPLDAIRYG